MAAPPASSTAKQNVCEAHDNSGPSNAGSTATGGVQRPAAPASPGWTHDVPTTASDSSTKRRRPTRDVFERAVNTTGSAHSRRPTHKQPSPNPEPLAILPLRRSKEFLRATKTGLPESKARP